MSNELEMAALEDTIEELQQIIQGLEYGAELFKLEIVERGDLIKALTVQNNTLKKQLMKKIETDVKIPAILKPTVREDNGEVS